MKSVMAQTYQGPIECLIVDDCGSDNSMEVVEKVVRGYQGPVDFIILHHDYNRGLSAARNTGMDAATGDYLFFLDSDDEISTDCIEKLALTLEEERYDLVVGNVQTEGNDEHGAFLRLKLEDGVVLRGKDIEDTYRKQWDMMAQNKLYRRDFICHQRLSFKEGLIHEDELWSLQVACLAGSLRVVNKFTYVYYLREGSIMHSSDLEERRCRMLTIIVAEICTFLKERKIFSRRSYQLMQMFFWQSLLLSWKEKETFIKDYCQLRAVSAMPLNYRIRACGLHPRTQLQNFYYLIPSRLAAVFIFWRYNHSK